MELEFSFPLQLHEDQLDFSVFDNLFHFLIVLDSVGTGVVLQKLVLSYSVMRSVRSPSMCAATILLNSIRLDTNSGYFPYTSIAFFGSVFIMLMA